MAKIQLKKSYTMSREEVRQGIEKLGQSLQKDEGMKYHWQGDDKVIFEHKAAKGFVQINSDSVEIELKLGMLYSAMAPLLRNKMHAVADKYIS